MSDLYKISVVINTYNEEDNISECIKSAKNIADEIIVVDMQSSDTTVKIASSNGAKVFNIKKYGYVEPARNFAIDKANYPWVFILDADERVTDSLIKKILEVVKEDIYDVVEIPFKNILLNKWIEHTGWWPDYHPRLFRKGFVRWPSGIIEPHILPVVKGRILKLDATEENAVIHNNINDIQDLLKMINKYTIKASFFENNKHITAEDVINYSAGEFKSRYFNERGYLDGMHGYILSRFMEFYKFLEFAKFWEKEGYPELVDNNKLKALLELNNPQEELLMMKASKIFKFWQIYDRCRTLIKKSNP